MEIKKSLLRFGLFLFKSLLASFLISFIGLCLVTKRFPPDLSKAKNLYSNVQKLKQLSHDVETKKLNSTFPQDEEMVSEYLKTRKELGSVLSQLNLLEATKDDESQNPEQCKEEKESIERLKEHIHRLDAEVNRLNSQLIQRTTVSK